MNPALLDWEFAFAVFAFAGAPYGGSPAIGGGETQETEMGPTFTYCHCVDAPSGCRQDWMEHEWVGVAISGNRLGMCCD